MSCGSTLRLTIEVPGESTITCDTAVETCRLLVLSLGGNSADRADVDARCDEPISAAEGDAGEQPPLAVLEHVACHGIL